MFGSFFGFEDIIEPVWLRPMDAMMDVPFIGKLNTVFIIAIGFGMGIILLCMIFNIMNSLKAKDTEKVWFDTNSVAGLVFYGSAVIVIVHYVYPSAACNVLKRASYKPCGKETGSFLKAVWECLSFRDFFEMFEVLLSYFSKHTFFRAYRCLCSQPCGYDAGCADAGRC